MAFVRTTSVLFCVSEPNITLAECSARFKSLKQSNTKSTSSSDVQYAMYSYGHGNYLKDLIAGYHAPAGSLRREAERKENNECASIG